MCIEHQCLPIHKTNNSEHKGTDRYRYNSSGRSQHPTSSIERASRQKFNKYPRTKQYHGQNGLNRNL
jgi:hypothetical protein